MLKICYWCLFTMHTKKAKLISCFVNDYCIPTTLFKTISKLKYLYIFNFFKKIFASCDLDFSKLPHFKKRCGTIRCTLLSSLSVCLSLSLCLSGVVNFALVRKLRTYALRTFHSILIRTYVHKQTYVDSHLPKRVITN
jgi:hypothetical protein